MVWHFLGHFEPEVSGHTEEAFLWLQNNHKSDRYFLLQIKTLECRRTQNLRPSLTLKAAKIPANLTRSFAMGGEDFSLKWNDHHSVFFSSAEQLCRGEILTDVTLSCGNVDFDAHKLVLSVCSGYFASIFSRNTDKHKNSHTIVYLKGVEPRHMELILR